VQRREPRALAGLVEERHHRRGVDDLLVVHDRLVAGRHEHRHHASHRVEVADAGAVVAPEQHARSIARRRAVAGTLAAMTNAWRVSIAAVMALVAGCGKGGEPSPGKGTSTGTGSGSGTGTGTGTAAPTPAQAARWKPIPRPPGSPACVAARQWFGYSATCVEQPLPELTTAAGTVRRLWSTSDPTRRWVYALTPPAGADVVAPSDSFSDGILYKVTQRLDLAKTPPEVLARLYAALSLQARWCAAPPTTRRRRRGAGRRGSAPSTARPA
jgi:hypothetical protein